MRYFEEETMVELRRFWSLNVSGMMPPLCEYVIKILNINETFDRNIIILLQT